MGACEGLKRGFSQSVTCSHTSYVHIKYEEELRRHFYGSNSFLTYQTTMVSDRRYLFPVTELYTHAHTHTRTQKRCCGDAKLTGCQMSAGITYQSTTESPLPKDLSTLPTYCLSAPELTNKEQGSRI
ncbi:unnamed protein product [Leuciscus chuanchicus]